MGRCPRCGTDTGPMGGLCASCNERERRLRDAAQRDAAERSKQDREKKKNSSGYKAPSAPMDPKVATVICVILAIALLLGAGWWIKSSYDRKSAEMTMEVFTQTLTGDGSAVVAKVLAREDDVSNWEISVTDYKKGFFGTLFGLKGDTARIKRYLQKDGTEVISFDFDGHDLGTGLKGEYYIVTIDGKVSVIDDKAELIYQEGSEFFDTNYPKLKALTYDAILSPLTEKVVGDKYGKNDQYEHILQANGWEMAVYDENRVIFTTDTEDLRTQYVADVSNSESNYTFELLNYKFYGEDTENLDELGKLLADADYSTSIEIFDGSKELVDIRYERNGKEHSFEFEANYGDFIGGTYYSYVINTEAKTIVYRYYSDEEAKWVDETPENSEAMYNELAGFIPETYLRNVMDLSKADKGGIGITTYTMKNDDGETTATLSLAFGKINKLIHYRDDGTRLEMSW